MLLEGSAISCEMITQRGYRTIASKSELSALGFSPVQRRVPGLLLLIHATDGSQPTFQYRPDSPRTDRQGKFVKYETPKGSGIRIDCPPSCCAQFGDPSTPLWITEGVKKGDALASQGLCAMALIGVWGFKGKNAYGGTTVLADLDFVAWTGRDVVIVFDSDAMTKKPVQQALERLTEILQRKGAAVQHCYLPESPEGAKVGVDDFLAAGHSVDELLALAAGQCDGSQTLFQALLPVRVKVVYVGGIGQHPRLQTSILVTLSYGQGPG